MSKAGLRRVVKTVRSQDGPSRRSYWIKAAEKAKRVAKFIGKHSGKIATGAAVVGTAYALYRHSKFSSEKQAAFHAFNDWIKQGVQRQVYRSAAGRRESTTRVDSPERRNQKRQSFDLNARAYRERRESAERSGHYSPVDGDQRAPRLRLGSGKR